MFYFVLYDDGELRLQVIFFSCHLTVTRAEILQYYNLETILLSIKQLNVIVTRFIISLNYFHS